MKKKHTHVATITLRKFEDITDVRCVVCGVVMAVNTNYGDPT